MSYYTCNVAFPPLPLLRELQGYREGVLIADRVQMAHLTIDYVLQLFLFIALGFITIPVHPVAPAH
ncbi:hypothetical protein M752DRAFT_279454, partial [Aspergillus phoenicis ATCC 13157]